MQARSRSMMMKSDSRSFSILTLKLLDICCHLMHSALILIFLIGWMVDALRFFHLVLSFLILFSWYGLGLIFGKGYCPVTDLQWKIKRHLGKDPGARFYVKYLIDKITGSDMNEDVIDKMTTLLFFLILIISAALFIIEQTV